MCRAGQNAAGIGGGRAGAGEEEEEGGDSWGLRAAGAEEGVAWGGGECTGDGEQDTH